MERLTGSLLILLACVVLAAAGLTVRNLNESIFKNDAYGWRYSTLTVKQHPS